MSTDSKSKITSEDAKSDTEKQNEQLLSQVAQFQAELDTAKQELESLQISYLQYRRLAAEGEESGLVVPDSIITEVKSTRELRVAAERMAAIGQLAGGVAHDFNNFLTIILGYAEDIVDGLPADSPLSSEAEEVLNAGLRAHDLTQKLLSISHKQLAQAQVLDLNNLLANLMDVLKQLIDENTVIVPALAENLSSIKSDKNSLEQMIVNLVIRARDTMPKGGRIGIETANINVEDASVSLYPELDTGQYVLLAISDTCKSQDSKMLSRMFEPYHIPEGKSKGYGLALTMVYSVIHQSGGHISVDNHQGKGTTIRMFLPVHESAPEEMSPPTPQIELSTNNELIMIVDDEESICNLVKKMVENMGFRTYVTAKCRDALLAVEDGLKPDLLISDVVMPVMNGVELGERIKSMIPDLKVLLMSGYTDNVLDNAGALGKNFPLLLKPFTSKNLAAQISALLSQSPSQTKTFAEIFMLDDDDSIRMLFQRACKKRGHNFSGAATPEEALRILATNPGDILLVDRNLLGLSGKEALQQIRSAGIVTPAIIFTGADTGEDINIYKALGVLRVMEKSFDNLPVFQFIEDFLGIKL